MASPEDGLTPISLPKVTLSRGQLLHLLARAQTGDKDARARLTEANLRLAMSVARRFTGAPADLEDLFQIACVGLVKAIDRFDPARGTAFSTYAVPVILGELRGYLRDASAVKVGRGAAGLAKRALATSDELSQRLGRSATVGEIASVLDEDPEEIVAALEAARPARSLDETIASDGDAEMRLGETLAATGEEAGASDGARVEHLALRQVLDRLPHADRRLLTMRFLQEKSQTEVAAALALSQASVSRWERRILEKVRTLLEVT